MTKRITCDCCKRDLTGESHFALESRNYFDNGWGGPTELHFCDMYRCLRGWVASQTEQNGWDKHPTRVPEGVKVVRQDAMPDGYSVVTYTSGGEDARCKVLDSDVVAHGSLEAALRATIKRSSDPFGSPQS